MSASIGPGGIEMDNLLPKSTMLGEPQSDQVELKCAQGFLIAALGLASIGPGGIEIREALRPSNTRRLPQSDQVELK